MPILAAEPNLHPEDLLERAADGFDADTWWVLYTRARHEKQLMRRLRNLDVAFYCPLIAKRNRSPAGRVRVSQVPLFSNYVFLRGCEQDRYTATTTNCISRCLDVTDGTQLTQDLIQIQRMIAAGVPVLPESRLQPGVHVRVKSGPFIGMEGVLIKRRGETRLMVTVNFLQQGASVLLADFEVEAI